MRISSCCLGQWLSVGDAGDAAMAIDAYDRAFDGCMFGH
jgi:hypothetical protein